MVSSRFRVFLDLIGDAARREAADFSREIDNLGEKWLTTKLTIKAEAKNVVGTINQVVRLTQTVMDEMGIILDPFADYIFGLIGITIQTLTQMAIAASSTVIGIPLGVAISTATGIFAVAALGATTQGLSEARASIDSISSIVSGIGNVTSSLTWLG